MKLEIGGASEVSAIEPSRVAVAPPALLGESPFWHPEQQALWYCDIPARQLIRFDPASGATAHWDFDTRRRQLRARARRHASSSRCATALALRPGERRAPPLAGRALRHRRASASTTASATRPGASGSARSTSRAAPARRPLVALRDGHPRAAPVGASRSATAWPGAPTAARCTGRHARRTRSSPSTSSRLSGAHDRPARVRPVRAQAATTGAGRLRRPARRRRGRRRGLLLGRDVRRPAPAAAVARRRAARARCALPVRCPTMPCFGGDDLKTLYVTTRARIARPADESAELPSPAACFAFRVDVPGLPVNFASA